MAKHKPLYMIRDDEESNFVLSLDKDYPQSRPATKDEISVEAIAEMLDFDAENSNHHGMVGCHKKLAEIMLKTITCDQTLEIMRCIADGDGLHFLADN